MSSDIHSSSGVAAIWGAVEKEAGKKLLADVGGRPWQAGETCSPGHSRNLSESRIGAVQCYDLPTKHVSVSSVAAMAAMNQCNFCLHQIQQTTAGEGGISRKPDNMIKNPYRPELKKRGFGRGGWGG